MRNNLRVSKFSLDDIAKMVNPVLEMKKDRIPAIDRKHQVLDAARTLFAKFGYSEVTLDAIAARCGISRPRIIQLFGSKRKIYEEIAESAYAAHPLDKDLAEPIALEDDFEVFRVFAHHILSHTSKRKDREIFKILLYARLREDSFHQLHFQKKDTLMISRLADYVAGRVTKGSFRDLDPHTIIYAYQAMVSNLAIYKNVMKQMDFVSIDELSRSCASIFLQGIRAD